MRGRVPVGVLLVVALFALMGVALAGTATAGGDGTVVSAGNASPAIPDGLAGDSPGTFASDHVESCAATPPSDLSDPDGDTADVVGWVEGYWYNEPVAVTPSDGFNQTELERLSKRTAARVEALRCLTYEEIPPLETVSRQEYQDDLEQSFEEQVTAEGELYENAQFAARLTVGQNEDAIQAQIEARAASPAAFYDTEEEFMAFVTDSQTVEGLDETILAHELTHALQDQNFDLSVVFEEPTNDGYLSSAGVVEGDADYVQEQYRSNCGSDWSDECIVPGQQSQPEIPNYGLLLNQLSVYHMPLVESTYESTGVESVNDLFGNWPATTTETINPELYGQFQPADITVEDGSGEDWRRVESGDLAYNTVGQAAITAMFMTPAFESGFQTTIVDPQTFVIEATQTSESFDYGIPETQGWQGDRLYGYANGENQTAAVWESAWETSDDAAAFADTYEALIEYRDGALADGYQNVYTFDDSEAYDMAVAVEQDGEQVVIVTAPSVEELTAVHDSVELQESSGSDDGGDDGSDDGGDGGSDDSDGGDGSDDDGAGFGLLVAAIGVAAVALGGWLQRRERN